MLNRSYDRPYLKDSGFVNLAGFGSGSRWAVSKRFFIAVISQTKEKSRCLNAIISLEIITNFFTLAPLRIYTQHFGFDIHYYIFCLLYCNTAVLTFIRGDSFAFICNNVQHNVAPKMFSFKHLAADLLSPESRGSDRYWINTLLHQYVIALIHYCNKTT